MAGSTLSRSGKLRKLLKAAQSQPAILEAMERPAEKAKPWYEYRPIFVTDRRIREGTEFWLAHRQALDRASVRRGVPPEYLAAILGRRDLLRPAHRVLPRARRARHAGLRLSAARQVLPRRARAVSPADPRYPDSIL